MAPMGGMNAKKYKCEPHKMPLDSCFAISFNCIKAKVLSGDKGCKSPDRVNPIIDFF